MSCELLKKIEEDNVPASVELTFLYDKMKLYGYSECEDVMKGIKMCIEHLTNIKK